MNKKQVIGTLLAMMMILHVVPSPMVYAESAQSSVAQADCTQRDTSPQQTEDLCEEGANSEEAQLADKKQEESAQEKQSADPVLQEPKSLPDAKSDLKVQTKQTDPDAVQHEDSAVQQTDAQVQLNAKMELGAGSQIKIWERLDGGNADPQNVGEYFEGQKIEYDGWQLMKLTITIPAQEGLEVTEITPQTQGLYPEKSTLVREDDSSYTYTYYFKGNGTYAFDISYSMHGIAGTDTVEYTIEDLVYIPDVTLLGFFIVAMDTNEVRGYITKTDLMEGRDYSQDGTYDIDKFLGPGTGGPGYYFPYVKNLEGMQYAQTMHQLEFYPGSWYGGKKPFDVTSLEPLTEGYYPQLTKFYLTAPYDAETGIKPEAYTSEMLGKILTKMPNLENFSANETGFKNFEVFAQMNGKMQSISCKGNKITSLRGLEGHTDLTHLSLNVNNISDLTPLKNILTAFQWNFIQNNISDLRPICKVKVNKVIHFGLQTVLPDPVLAKLNGETYKLVLPMPIDIDGTNTQVGFASWLKPQIGNQVPQEQRTKLLVKYSEDNIKLYPITQVGNEVYAEIPKADVPNAGTSKAFENTVMRFWFHNDNGSDNRTKGNFNGKVDFTATVQAMTHSVTYEFAASGNQQLPQEVLQQLPAKGMVEEGQSAVVPADLVLQDVKTQDGIWSFVSWNKAKVENVTQPVVFTGTWKFSKFATPISKTPVIHAADRTLIQGDEFDPKQNVTAADAQGNDLTDKILVVDSTVDTSKAGLYQVIYKVTDDKGISATKTIQVKVNPKQEYLNEAPNISAKDKVLMVGDVFDKWKDVSAKDKEDGDLTKSIEIITNTVDTSKAGLYAVTYKVTDKQGASAVKTITVTVKEKQVVSAPTDTQNPQNTPAAPTEPKKPIDPPSNVPQTGDNSHLVLWCLLALVGAAGIFQVAHKKKKYNK